MAGSTRYTAILDANVLYPNLMRDILLSMASVGFYRARWTARIKGAFKQTTGKSHRIFRKALSFLGFRRIWISQI
jgi:hypothetical protein